MVEVKDVTGQPDAAPGLSETLAASWDEMEAAEESEEQAVEETVAEETPEPSTEESEKPVEEAPEAEEEEEETEKKPSWEPGKLSPHEHWTKDDKETFRSLPQSAQELVMKKDREFQADYTRKMQAIADLRRSFEPVRQELEQFGVSEADAVRRLVGAHLMLKQNPQQAIRYIAEQYGIDLGRLDEAPPRPDESRALQEVNSIRQALIEREKAAYVQRVQDYDSKINEFKKDKEFFDELQPDMMRIAQSYITSGQPIPDIPKLYDEAVWSNATIREKVLAADRAKDEKAKLDAEKARVAKAKKAAGARVRSTPTSEERTEKPHSLRDQIEDQWQRAEQT